MKKVLFAAAPEFEGLPAASSMLPPCCLCCEDLPCLIYPYKDFKKDREQSPGRHTNAAVGMSERATQSRVPARASEQRLVYVCVLEGGTRRRGGPQGSGSGGSSMCVVVSVAAARPQGSDGII